MNPDLWLEHYYDKEYFTGRFDHLKDFVHKLDLDSLPIKIITVAGTNGKGETCRIISHLLHREQVSFGLWTSPHLEKVNERFHFNGRDVGDSELLSVFSELRAQSESLKVKLSYFEFLFVSFMLLAKKYQVAITVLEVGLGGRLDAVNVMNADICVLTSISRDHQDVLGFKYKSILLEKLGILRDHSIFISAIELDYLKGIIKKQLRLRQIKWSDLFSNKLLNKEDHFSKRNQSLAVKVVEKVLGKKIKLPKELDQFSKRLSLKCSSVSFDLFPSHNVDGLRKLVHFLKDSKYTNYDFVLISFSDRELCDLRVMTKIVLNYFKCSKVLLYRFEHFKAVKEEKLQAISNEFNIEVTDDKNLFQKFNTEKTNKDRATSCLLTGSNYFLGQFIDFHKGQLGQSGSI